MQIRLGKNVVLVLQYVVLRNARAAPLAQSPGVDLLSPSDAESGALVRLLDVLLMISKREMNHTRVAHARAVVRTLTHRLPERMAASRYVGVNTYNVCLRPPRTGSRINEGSPASGSVVLGVLANLVPLPL